MPCSPVIDSFTSADGKLDVVDKYDKLMQASLADDSLYMRMKDTMYQQFKDLQLNEKEKAGFVVDYMTKFSVDLAKHAMSQGLEWAKEERDGNYTLAKIKADTELALANFELVKANICKTEKEKDLICAQVTKTMADSIRQNGYVTEYQADGCTPKLLDETGLVFNQTLQVKGATYQTFADAYRKSGVVQVGTDTQDSVYKGLSGDDDGYTNQQSKNAERQRIAYEDSKLNHAINSSSTMIGQLLSSETFSASNAQDIEQWRRIMDKLELAHSSTSNP